MDEKIYFTAAEVAQMLGISLSKSYKLLQKLNAELDRKGFMTIKGKVPTAYFKENWYGAGKEANV